MQPALVGEAQQCHNCRLGGLQHAERLDLVADEVVHKQDLVQLPRFLVGNSHDQRRRLVLDANRRRRVVHRPFACSRCTQRRRPTRC